MGSKRFESNDIDRLLRPGRADDPLSGNPLFGRPGMARLLEPLRAGPGPDEVAGAAQAVLSIAALIRSHPVAPTSNLAAVHPSERNRPRSLTEKFAASVLAAALATTTGLVAIGVFPHSAGRSAAGVETSTEVQGGIRPPQSADGGPSPRSVRGRLSSERSRSAVSAAPAPATSGKKAQSTSASRPTQTERPRSGQGSGKRGGGSGSGTGSGSGSDQGGGGTRGGDRGQGKDRGKGNDDRLVDGGGHQKNKMLPPKGGAHRN